MDWMKTARANARAMDQTMRQNPYKARLRQAGEHARKNGLAPQSVQTAAKLQPASSENKLSGLTDLERMSLVFGNKTTNVPLSDNLKTAGEQIKSDVNAKLVTDGEFANAAVKNLRANGLTEIADSLKSQLDAMERERNVGELRENRAAKDTQQISIPKPIFPQSSISSFASPGVKEIGENLITRYNAQAMLNYMGSRKAAHKKDMEQQKLGRLETEIEKKQLEVVRHNLAGLPDEAEQAGRELREAEAELDALRTKIRQSEQNEWYDRQYLEMMATGGAPLVEEFTEHYIQLRDAVDKASVTNPGVQNNGAWISARENYDRWYNDMVGRLGKDNVDRWIEYGTQMHNREVSEKHAEQLYAFGQKNPVGASLMTVPMRIVGITGIADAFGQKIENMFTGKDYPIDYNTPAQIPSRFASEVRRGTSDRIEAGWGGKTGSFLYNAGMSLLDRVPMLAAGNVGAILLSGDVATNAMHNAKKRGATDEQALFFGMVSGAVDGVMEKVSFDHLLNLEKAANKTDVIINAFKKMGLKGTEDGLATVANTMVDLIINKDKSAINSSVAYYKSLGMNPESAKRMAMKDWGKELVLDIGYGSIASLPRLSTAAASKMSQIKWRENATGKQISDFVQNAYSNKNTHGYLRLFEASGELAANLHGAGIEVDGYVHVLQDNDIRHIREHYGDLSNAKHKVTSEDVKNVAELIGNYDKLYFGKDLKSGRTTIMYEKTTDKKIFLVEEISDDGTLNTRQMMKTGKHNKPGFLRKFKLITDRTSDTDVPAKPDPAGESPPGKHVQDAEEAASYSTSVSLPRGFVKGEEINLEEIDEDLWEYLFMLGFDREFD